MIRTMLARSCAPFLPLVDRRLADRRLQVESLRQSQTRILQSLVGSLATLPIGRHFGLDQLAINYHLPELFRNRISEKTYADHASFITRVAEGESDVMFAGKAAALAQTSGTTSKAASGERYIPQNEALLRHHARGGMAAMARLLRTTGTHVLDGQSLMLGGSTALTPNNYDIPVGDLSGIIAARVPAWLRPLYEPGLEIALESDWDRKLNRIAERCGKQDIRLVTGIPAWCMMLFDRICRERGLSRARTAWPTLSGFIHGGHAITPFIPNLREHLSPDTAMMEVYPASEAFIAIGSRCWSLAEKQPPVLELLSNHGVYLEFAPQDGGETVGAEGLEPGRIYRILLTTPGGLVRYQLGDLVEGVAPGYIRVAGRIKTRMSAFGEHVEGVHLDGAITNACQLTRGEIAYYHVTPRMPTRENPVGAHEWLIEFSQPPSSLAVFSDIIDHFLRTHVIDYDAHRLGGQIAQPVVTSLARGTFHRFLSASGKMGGQHKVPQAWNDRSIADQLISFSESMSHKTSDKINSKICSKKEVSHV
jgi:GH3 auxin-responsive promoter